MIGLDTNVLVRYLTQDDAAQAALVNRLFERTLSEAAPGFVSSVVLCEVTWVLRAAYDIEPKEILRAVEGLLTTRQLTIEHSEEAWKALTVCQQQPRVSFSDALIGQLALKHGALKTLTFDKTAAKLDAFELLR